MPVVYFDPDESHRFTSIEAESCVGLEALTGADFIISELPIDPVESIQWHVENGSMFCNIKAGYDFFLHHEQRHKFAARTQALGVNNSRRLYLGVGDYTEDRDGNLRCGFYKPLRRVTWLTYEHMLDDAMNRGLFWRTIKEEGELPAFIERMARLMEQPREVKVYAKQSYQWDDPWQMMEEVNQRTVVYTLACGLWNMGPKRAQSLVDYLIKHSLPVNLFQALSVLSQINAKNKFTHKVSGIGTDYQKWIRDLMFSNEALESDEDYKLLEGFNICLETTDNENEFHRGARSGLARFHEYFDKELKATDNGKARLAKTAYNNAMKAALILINQQYRVRQLPGEEFPF